MNGSTVDTKKIINWCTVDTEKFKCQKIQKSKTETK